MKLVQSQPRIATSTGVSLEEIAERVGVSTMTVSRVLSGKGKGERAAAAKRAELIRTVAQEMGYRRHSAPRAMITGRYNCVGVLRSADMRRNHLPEDRLRGIEQALAERQVNLMLALMTDERLGDEKYVPSILSNWMVDGLLVDLLMDIPPRLESLVRHYRVPAVWMNSKHEGDCVYPDDMGGARAATEALLSLGHKRITAWRPFHPPGHSIHYSVEDRTAGYAAAMTAAGLQPRVLVAASKLAYAEQSPFLQPELRRPDRPTAVITYGPPQAAAAYAAAARVGLRVPEDLSIITFAHDLSFTDALGVAAMVLPERQLGERAVRMLMQKIDRPADVLDPVAMPMHLEPAASCAPPPPPRP